MKEPRIIDLIQIDDYSATAKYMQIVNSVIGNITAGSIRLGDLMPSINELSCELGLARLTIERAYNYLRGLGLLDAVPRKGYYIKQTDVKQKLNILLLFNKLSEHKKIIYDSFVATLSDNATIDLYVYNNDYSLFKRQLTNRPLESYSHCVIVPHFIEESEQAHQLIDETIPKEKLVLLDKLIPGMTGEYAAVYEDFGPDIYKALTEAADQLAKYSVLKIIFPKHSYYPAEIVEGFVSFCQDHAFAYQVVQDISLEQLSAGEAYITVMEDDLVTLVEHLLRTDLKAGEQVGIISYNETRIKKLILSGITTISTDFHQLGVRAAELILSRSKAHIAVPFRLQLRSSL